ncbi:MAG: hypothetical protein JWQ81_8185 [Amycolatopsis sp.]|nr:hypothetical protein [Amycolatopsis sp.]
MSLIMEGPENVSEDVRGRLLRRLAALNSAPTDEDLWRELAEVLKSLDDPEFTRGSLRDKLRARRERIALWLTRSGSGVDAVSGLPWSEIARYRVVEDPDFGPVPQYVGSARQLAIRDASEHEHARGQS